MNLSGSAELKLGRVEGIQKCRSPSCHSITISADQHVAGGLDQQSHRCTLRSVGDVTVTGNMENRSGHGVFHAEFTERIGAGVIQSSSVLDHVVFLGTASSTIWSSEASAPQVSTNRFTCPQWHPI